MLDERGLARRVAVEHAADLRQRDVRFVHHQQHVVREEVQQRVRRLARRAAAEPARVVLDAGAIADLAEHVEVVAAARLQPLRFEQLPFHLELFEAVVEFLLDADDRLARARLRRDEVLGGIDEQLRQFLYDLAGDGVDDAQRIDVVAEEFDAVADFLGGGPDFDRVAADAELAALEGHVVALVLDVHELEQQVVAVDGFSLGEVDHHPLVVGGRAEAVDARDGRDDDDVLAADERRRGREAEAVDVLVDARIFFDVDVALRDVGFGLVVVVVADEVTDGVLGEELLHFFVELGGEGLVVRDDERGLVQGRDDVRGRERLAGPGRAEEHLHRLSGGEALAQFADRLRLVAGRGVIGDEFELCGHAIPSFRD